MDVANPLWTEVLILFVSISQELELSRMRTLLHQISWALHKTNLENNLVCQYLSVALIVYKKSLLSVQNLQH